MTKTIRHPSAVPILGAGGVWLAYCLFLPLAKPWQFLFPAALSAAAYLVLRRLFPGRTETVTVQEKTGNEALDAMLLQAEQSIRKIRSLGAEISDLKLSRQIDELETLTERIFASVKRNPEKLPQIRQFMNYYLPTVLRLLEQYSVLQHEAVKGGSAEEAMGKIAGMMDAVLTAFRRQLDTLYEKDAMDITADIRVMEQMMRAQGILGADDFQKQKE